MKDGVIISRGFEVTYWLVVCFLPIVNEPAFGFFFTHHSIPSSCIPPLLLLLNTNPFVSYLQAGPLQFFARELALRPFASSFRFLPSLQKQYQFTTGTPSLFRGRETIEWPSS
jgi:hypothetical protein